jgi:hypothetical protein
VTRAARGLGRALLPAAAFAVVATIHYLWLGLFPDRDPVQDRWSPVAALGTASWSRRYLDGQDYWLGFSYAAPVAFAAAAWRRYREERLGAARNLAIGGVTLSAVLSATACFLLGCCGSPMLGVYLSLFGAAFLPFAKPLIAALTAISLGLG